MTKFSPLGNQNNETEDESDHEIENVSQIPKPLKEGRLVHHN